MELIKNSVESLKQRLIKDGVLKTNIPKRVFPTSYEIEQEEYNSYYDEIAEIEAKQEYCKECKGVDLCKQDDRGIFPTVVPYFGKFNVRYVMCNKEKTARNQKKLDDIMLFAKIPDEFAGLGFDDYNKNYEVTQDNEKAIRAAKYIVENESSKGALFFGGTGTGKSMLAAMIVNEKVKKGVSSMFASIPDLLLEIRCSFKKGNTAEILRAIIDVPLLVLDDLGSEKMTQWVGEQLFMIINSRISAKRQTIFTANYQTNELYDRLSIFDEMGKIVDDMQGKRIMSRIFGMCYVVKLDGKDYRRI